MCSSYIYICSIYLAGLCCPWIFLCIWIPSDVKVQSSYIHASCCEKQNKIKLLISAQSTCQRQFPSPTHSDIKLVTFSPTVQSPPFQVCEVFLIFLFLVYCVASRHCLHVFPENLSVCSLYFSIISLLPSVFQYVYFSLPFYFIFSQPFPLPFLSLNFSPAVPKIFSPPL